jgi:purine-nucleoside phosphorylase
MRQLSHTAAEQPLSPALEEAIRRLFPQRVDAVIVLGSGLGGFAASVEITASISTRDLPGYPVSTIEGHDGRLIAATAQGKSLLLFQGRVHGYEGYDAASTALPAFIAAALGARVLVLTNAAGGLEPSFVAGDLMLVTDVLVLPGARDMGLELQRGIPSLHPLPRPLFHPDVLDLARRAASESNVRLREGVYGFCSGPTYETRAEIGFYRLAGAQAVGMSTASEVFAAAQYNLPVVAVSCVTNIARTVRQAVSHDEVTAVAAQASDRLGRLVHALLRLL